MGDGAVVVEKSPLLIAGAGMVSATAFKISCPTNHMRPAAGGAFILPSCGRV
jgi:hypothetical protein